MQAIRGGSDVLHTDPDQVFDQVLVIASDFYEELFTVECVTGLGFEGQRADLDTGDDVEEPNSDPYVFDEDLDNGYNGDAYLEGMQVDDQSIIATVKNILQYMTEFGQEHEHDEALMMLLDETLEEFVRTKEASHATFVVSNEQEADNVHVELLRYLFSCACQPYLVFVHSWLYRASLKDPYNEFVVQEPKLMASAGSGSQQVDTPNVTPDANATTTELYIDKNLAGDFKSFVPKGNAQEVEGLQAPKVTSECLSHSVAPEPACGLKERKETTQQHELDCADFPRAREVAEAERTGSIVAEGHPFSSKSNMGSKLRKRWIEPSEVVILHGQSEEDASLELLPAEENLDICRRIHYVSYEDVEPDAICDKLKKEEDYELSMSDRDNSPLYSFPALTEAKLQSGMDLKCQVGGPSLQLSTLARSQFDGASFFFFPDINLEVVGSEIFGRSYMHKLAQNYKVFNTPQSDGYRKITSNFNAVSQKFWSFDDCISDGSLYMNIFPSILFTSASNVAGTLSLDNKRVYLPHSEAQNEMEQSKADGQNFADSLRNLPNVFGAPTLCKCSPFRSSKAEPLVKFRAETPLERLKEDERLESLVKASQSRQGVHCGGATWQSYLGLRGHEDVGPVAVPGTALESSEVPLEVIIEKCIIQEVLSQYQCISHFSVRLLHQVFGLEDHLAALRRYFFMERGDWAETFTSALYHNAWHPTGPSQRQLEVQMLLEAAVQNSSCQEDDYAERLHVCVEEGGKDFPLDVDNLGHVYINKTSLFAFDFITLGYRLEWPVSLIITSNSLKLYNSTFCFLIHAKLAAHAVNDIWRFLKDLLHGCRQGDTSQKQEWLNTLMLFRQQVDHFVTTLQGHLETQLLHNVWRKFLQALHHEGKDLLDLEILHGLYLQDALHVCFLSEETKSVKTHIEDIMQCLIELSGCLNILGKQQNGEATLESEKVQSAILEAKNHFESSMRQLLEIALNRHNHFALSQFWTRLDFNGFFGR
ncbi:hypothetical protein L7F22_026984 [Adiantum nelumboides]|nr:hypothetical protein [Adiantum nelumboides]